MYSLLYSKTCYFTDFLVLCWKKYILNLSTSFSCLHLNTRHSHLQLGLLRCPLPGYPCFCSFLPPGSTLPQARPSRTVFYTEANLIFQKCELWHDPFLLRTFQWLPIACRTKASLFSWTKALYDLALFFDFILKCVWLGLPCTRLSINKIAAWFETQRPIT